MRQGSRGVCIREVQKTLKESAKRLIEDKIQALGVGGYFNVLNTEIQTPGGGVILFQGMQDHTAESIKSLEGFDWAWVEEAQTLSARSLEMLRPTIRAPGSELWFSWNPRNANDPVDQLLRGPTPPPDAVVIRANYSDNPFFPKELEAERAYDEAHKRDRYAHIWLGEYEPTAIGAIWDRVTIHNGRRDVAPELDRIVVAVDPAISAEANSDEHGIVVAGLGTDQRGYVLDDVSLKGGPRQWAERAIAAYDRFDADAIVVEINQGGDMVRHTLESVRPGIRIVEVRATRGKHVRAEPISALYSLGRVSHVGTFSKLEDQMCQMTAAGYEGDGSPDRCLIAGTLIETISGPAPIEKVQAGDLVLTRSGYRRVIAAQKTGVNVPVVSVILSNGNSVTGTKNHPVYVDNIGFLTIDALVWGDILSSLADRSIWQKLKVFGSRVSSLFAIQTVKANRPVDIIMSELTADRTAQGCFTGLFGNVQTAQSRAVRTFTILTGILSTTTCRISNWFRQQTTRLNTNLCMALNFAPSVGTISNVCGFSLPSGTVQKKVSSGISRTASIVGLPESRLTGFVFNVARNISHLRGAKQTDFVPGHVSANTMNRRGDTTKTGHVSFAGRNSTSRKASRKKYAPVSVVGLSDAGRADVYNLAVEIDNEYYANGVLVHNCDALVWALTELFPSMVTTRTVSVHVEPLGPSGWMG